MANPLLKNINHSGKIILKPEKPLFLLKRLLQQNVVMTMILKSRSNVKKEIRNIPSLQMVLHEKVLS